MNEIRITVEKIGEFFRGARDLAQRVDAARPAASLSFETMETLFQTLTPNAKYPSPRPGSRRNSFSTRRRKR